MVIKNFFKKISARFQTSKESYRRHNAEFLVKGKLESERLGVKRLKEQDMFSHPDNKFGFLLNKYPNVRGFAVDIGSGNGWLSAELSAYFKKVIGIEPSKMGIEIAKQLFPLSSYPQIEWKEGFAEEVLPTLNFSEPVLFVTGCVLSHLRDKEVADICRVINDKAPVGSILGFSECWGEEWHQIRWHVRTKEWWQKNLNNWDIDFHGPQVEVPGRHKGFHAVKVK